MIEEYPEFSPLSLEQRPILHPRFQRLAEGTSELTFAGIYQYVNQAFVATLPEKYELVNREQDLGEPGLRRAKESYRPVVFVRKYRAARQ